MGTFRLALSLLVVASHFGGMGDTPAGGTAVASFFAISGFLMARTIEENYSGLGYWRFYLNRLIRPRGLPMVSSNGKRYAVRFDTEKRSITSSSVTPNDERRRGWRAPIVVRPFKATR